MKHLQKLLILFIALTFTAAVPYNNSIVVSNDLNNPGSKDGEKSFDVSEGGTLNVELKTGGSIEITGWSKDEVKVEYELDGSDADEIKVEIEQDGNDVNVVLKYSDRDNDYSSDVTIEIKVPHNYNTELTTMGGKLELSNVNGENSGETMGGAIQIKNVDGRIKYKTMGGSITIKDCKASGSVMTMGGNIKLENIDGDIQTKTMGGNIIQRNVKSSENVEVSTMGGSLKVDRAEDGVKLKTMGGDIDVNYAAKFAIVETYGGDIEIKEVDGKVKAKTMGGDIRVKVLDKLSFDNKDVRLTSMSGDIVLEIPKDFSMELEIEIEYEEDHENRVELISNIPLNKRIVDIDRKSDLDKMLKVNKTLNGGDHKVKIKTYNSKVTIREY